MEVRKVKGSEKVWRVQLILSGLSGGFWRGSLNGRCSELASGPQEPEAFSSKTFSLKVSGSNS